MLYFSDCCPTVEIVQGSGNNTGAYGAQSKIFTTYRIEPNLVNGKVHYTSVDLKHAIAYNDKKGQWVIQSVKDR